MTVFGQTRRGLYRETDDKHVRTHPEIGCAPERMPGVRASRLATAR